MSATPQTQRAQLEGLAHFAAIFSTPGYQFMRWHDAQPDPSGTVVLGSYALSDEAEEFCRMLHRLRLVLQFNWIGWMAGEEARALLQDPAALKTAHLAQIRKLLTVFIRQERFVEGTLQQAFQDGFITAICIRAQVLLQEMHT